MHSLRLECHKVVSYASCIINGDEFGGQKTCLLGGVPRARHSHQSVCRGIDRARALFDGEVGLWHRSFHFEELLAKTLGELGDNAPVVAEAVAKEIGVRGKRSQEGDTSLGLLTCDLEIDEIAKIIDDWHRDGRPLLKAAKNNGKDKKGKAKSDSGKTEAEGGEDDEEKKGKKEGPKLDEDLATAIMSRCKDWEHSYLATRGRFIAGRPELTRLATRYVASGIGTTPYQHEPEFANAYDDEAKTIEWMGRTELASMVMYYYYLYDILETYRRLSAHRNKEEAIAAAVWEAVAEMEAFGSAIPLARARTTAPFAHPSFYLAIVTSGGQPINYEPAFVIPCGGVVDTVARIDGYAVHIAKNCCETRPSEGGKSEEDKFAGLDRIVLERNLWCTAECTEHLVHFDPKEIVDRKVLRANIRDAIQKFLQEQ